MGDNSDVCAVIFLKHYTDMGDNSEWLLSVQLSFFTYMAIINQWNRLQWIHAFSAKQ